MNSWGWHVDFNPESESNNSSSSQPTPPGAEQIPASFTAAQYPSTWRFRPVLGKHPLVEGWVKNPLTADSAITAYQKGHINKVGKLKHFNGFAVFTGELSGGLLALDIDGPDADTLYKKLAGDEYEKFGEESTMAVTSGKPSRRQLFYQVPTWMISWLTKFTVKHLEPQQDGPPSSGKKTEELVLRFNQCFSVLPGSTHPETKEYKLTSENGNYSVSQAPNWIIEILNENKKASKSFLTPEIREFLEDSNILSGLPDHQLLGWFAQKETQKRVEEKLFTVFYNHHIFGEWNTANERRTSNFCPFHGGDSGDSFHVDTRPGEGHGWDCKVCNHGGGPLQFLNAVKHQNIYEPLCTGVELQDLISQVATYLGFKYPDDLLPVKKVANVPEIRGSSPQFFKAAIKLRDKTPNSEQYGLDLMTLSSAMGAYFKSPQIAKLSVDNWERQELSLASADNNIDFRFKEGSGTFLVPDLIKIPSLIMLHGASGTGKTRVALGLSRIIGENLSMKVRGTNVTPLKKGNVLYISDDMDEDSFSMYAKQLGIDGVTNNWLKVKYAWSSDEIFILKKQIAEHQPVLIVIDSLTSVSGTTISENDPFYASFLYNLRHANGRDWPACAIMVIHHDKKDGSDFRGSSALRGACDEMYHLKKLTEEELSIHGPNSLMINIHKSRSGRDLAKILVKTDINGIIKFEDLDTIDSDFLSGASSKLAVKELVLCLLRKNESTASELYDKICRIYEGRGLKDISDDLDIDTIQNSIDSWINSKLIKVTDEKILYDGVYEESYVALIGKSEASKSLILSNTIVEQLEKENKWLDIHEIATIIFSSIESKYVKRIRKILQRLVSSNKLKTELINGKYLFAHINFSGEVPENLSEQFLARQDRVLNALTISENWVCIKEIYNILEDKISEQREMEAISKVLNHLQEEKLVKMRKFRLLHSAKPIMYFALIEKEDLLPPAGLEPELEEAPSEAPAAELAEVSLNNDSVIPAAEQVIEVEPLPQPLPLPLPPAPLSPRSGELEPAAAIEPPLPPIPPWVPLPPEGNSQLEWASHWQDIFDD